MFFVLSAPDKQVSNLCDQLKAKSLKIVTFDNLFEFKRRSEKEKPEIIFVADNLKEKNTVDLLNAIQKIERLEQTPIFALVTSSESQAVISFLKNGAIDAVSAPFELEEIIARIDIRLHETQLRQHFTSAQFFFNEVQEKEQGKRTGVYKFFDNQNIEVGNISIKEGRMVHATYGTLIKEDAFLQLACNDDLKFIYEDMDDVKNTNTNEGITNLLLEASKLKDEIKRQEGEDSEEIKVLIIDGNRIARIMASRVIKSLGYTCKVTSPKEMTVRFMASFAPQLLIMDYDESSKVLDMLWPTPRTEKDIPVIIYCDEDVKDINFNQIKNHSITATVYKNKFHEEKNAVLQKAKIL